MQKMERLLQYLSKHKDYGIRYYASNMQLQGQSDASYLSRPRAKSVCGVSKLHTEVVPAQHNTRHKANVRQADEKMEEVR